MIRTTPEGSPLPPPPPPQVNAVVDLRQEQHPQIARKTGTYKYCIVPKCTNTTSRTPDKCFFYVPRDVTRRKWCKAMKQDKPLSLKSSRYCCEDHFDIEADVSNLVKYKLVGGRLTLKTGVIPHKFDCQKQVPKSVKPRSTVEKRRRIEKADVIENLLKENSSSSEIAMSQEGGNAVEENHQIQTKDRERKENDKCYVKNNEMMNKQMADQEQIKEINEVCKSKTTKVTVETTHAVNLLEIKIEPIEIQPEEGQDGTETEISSNVAPADTNNDYSNIVVKLEIESSVDVKEEVIDNTYHGELTVKVEHLQSNDQPGLGYLGNDNVAPLEYQTNTQKGRKRKGRPVRSQQTTTVGPWTADDQTRWHEDVHKSLEDIRAEYTSGSSSQEYVGWNYQPTAGDGITEQGTDLPDKRSRKKSVPFSPKPCAKKKRTTSEPSDVKERRERRLREKEKKRKFDIEGLIYCDTCNKPFESHWGYRWHMHRSHKVDIGKRDHKCKLCKASFEVLSSLKRHMAKNHAGVPLNNEGGVCSMCSAVFKSQATLGNHMARQHGIKTETFDYQCPHCSSIFNLARNFRRHMRSQHQVLLVYYKCPYCPKAFFSIEDYLDHLESKVDLDTTSKICPKCNQSFESITLLGQHMRSKHKDKRNVNMAIANPASDPLFIETGESEDTSGVSQLENIHRCERCPSTFRTENLLWRHVQREHKTGVAEFYNCKLCGKISSNEKYLKVHMKEMHSTKVYKCVCCNKEFGNLRLLRHHLAKSKRDSKQPEQGPVVCSLCPATYDGRYAGQQLARHIANTHRQQCCTKCDFKTETEEQLKEHELSHSQATTYRCNVESCEFVTMAKFRLKGHIFKHHAGQGKCPMCSFESDDADLMKHHIYKHMSGRDPFFCDKCSFVTTTFNKLNLHKIEHTSKKKRTRRSKDASDKIEKCYKCDHCSYESKRRNDIKIHLREHMKSTFRF